MNELPAEFIERCRSIVPPDAWPDVFASFSETAGMGVRINTLKTSVTEMMTRIRDSRVDCHSVPWSREALWFPSGAEDALRILDDCFVDGRLYRQSLSSQLPVLALGPQPGERVLDLCAAPGSKTSQIAAFMRDEGELTAVDSSRIRCFKLKSVLAQTGCRNVRVVCKDGRYFRDRNGFDRILVDAPCSSEGRFHPDKPESCRFWSRRKIKEMVTKQRGLLRQAIRLVRPGGVVVYATCTMAPEENEGVLDWVLEKADRSLRLEPVHLEGVPAYPSLLAWEGRTYRPEVAALCRVLPGRGYHAFAFVRIVAE